MGDTAVKTSLILTFEGDMLRERVLEVIDVIKKELTENEINKLIVCKAEKTIMEVERDGFIANDY